MFSKKGFLIISGLVCLFLLGFHLAPEFFSPLFGTICNNSDCYHVTRNVLDSLLVFFSLFLVSIPVYFLRVEIFNIWRWFAVVWIPFSVIYAYQTPEGHQLFISSGPWLTAVEMSVAFIIISFVIIVVSELSYRVEDRNKRKNLT